MEDGSIKRQPSDLTNKSFIVSEIMAVNYSTTDFEVRTVVKYLGYVG